MKIPEGDLIRGRVGTVGYMGERGPVLTTVLASPGPPWGPSVSGTLVRSEGVVAPVLLGGWP